MIVWIASYPRSGNTYFRVLLNSKFGLKTYSIHGDTHDIAADLETSDVVGHKELPRDFDISAARKDKKLYVIKTHELPDTFLSDTDKIVYILRDGRESTLSYLKYEHAYGNKNKTLEDIIIGNTFCGSWGEHVSKWSPLNRQNVLFIKFEELVSDPITHVDKVSSFIQIKTREGEIPTFSELKKINSKFFRSGKKTSWRKEFSKFDEIYFWQYNYNAMVKYGYCNYVPDICQDDKFILFSIAVSGNQNIINLLRKYQSELQSKNSELRSKNSELRSKNSELRSKNSEFQSKNSELQSKNSELQSKNSELRSKNSELQQQLELLNSKRMVRFANVFHHHLTNFRSK